MPLKKLFILALALGHPAYGSNGARSQAVRLHEIKQGPQVLLLAENTDKIAPRHLRIDFKSLNNALVSQSLPLQAVLRPGEKKELLRISPASPAQGMGYRFFWEQGFGDPGAVHDDGVLYLLPWEHGKKHPVGQGYFGALTHQGIRALDFDMNSGTKVCAARDGVVVALRQDSSRGGPSGSFALDSNYIDILHADGTWATYAHLKKNGALVHIGQRVKAGQVIGLSGATGQASGPHLHFSVQKATYGLQTDTLATRFMLSGSEAALVQEGNFYYSWHPGGSAFTRIDADKLDEAALALKTKPAHGGKLSFRQERLDNRDLIYCVNGSSQKQEVTYDFGSSQNAQPSKPLPYTQVVPPHTEAFLLSVAMTAGHSSYQSRFQSRPLP